MRAGRLVFKPSSSTSAMEFLPASSSTREGMSRRTGGSVAKELLEMFNLSKVVQALNSVGSIEILLVEIFRSGEGVSQYKSNSNYLKKINNSRNMSITI